MTGSGLRLAIGCAGCVALAIGAATLAAQDRREGFGRGRGEGFGRIEANATYDGRFTFVRLRYNGGSDSYGRLPFWAHDYPSGERHFMKILQEVTFLAPRTEETNILTLDDPELGKYPVAYMSEPGYWTTSDEEAEGLRTYLEKGGFVIFDDFRGYDWDNFETQIHRVLPGAQIVDLDASHPVFHSFFEIDSFDIVPQFYDRGMPSFRAIFEGNDPAKRLMVLINYNTDISEFWEWSDTGIMPIDESNEAYKLGVNYVIYAMTH